MRRYIHENLGYRFAMLPDEAAAYAVEAVIKSGGWERGRPLSFPKNPSVRICAMGQNQRIIRCDACDPSSAWDGYHQPI